MTVDRDVREVCVGAAGRRVTETDLRDIVSRCKSWRGVLRAVGLSSTRAGRTLRARADAWGIDYTHFGHQHGGPRSLGDVVAQSRSWAEALERLGYSSNSGSARANVRRQCRALAIDCDHVDEPVAVEPCFDEPVDLVRLREAGTYLVAGQFALRG